MESRKPWQSKTLWSSIAVAALPAIPGVRDVVAANPQESMAVVSGIFAILRAITKGRISL